MKLPKSVLIKMKASLIHKTIKQLEELLALQNHKLASLQNTNKETYDYLSFPIQQKIQLIQDEINQRSKTVSY